MPEDSARLIEVSVCKSTPSEKIGLILMQEEDDSILVHSIAEGSLFSGTRLQAGMEVLSINDVSLEGMTFGKAMRLLRDAHDEIHVVAQEVTSSTTTDEPESEPATLSSNHSPPVVAAESKYTGKHFSSNMPEIHRCVNRNTGRDPSVVAAPDREDFGERAISQNQEPNFHKSPLGSKPKKSLSHQNEPFKEPPQLPPPPVEPPADMMAQNSKDNPTLVNAPSSRAMHPLLESPFDPVMADNIASSELSPPLSVRSGWSSPNRESPMISPRLASQSGPYCVVLPDSVQQIEQSGISIDESVDVDTDSDNNSTADFESTKEANGIPTEPLDEAPIEEEATRKNYDIHEPLEVPFLSVQTDNFREVSVMSDCVGPRVVDPEENNTGRANYLSNQEPTLIQSPDRQDALYQADNVTPARKPDPDGHRLGHVIASAHSGKSILRSDTDHTTPTDNTSARKMRGVDPSLVSVSEDSALWIAEKEQDSDNYASFSRNIESSDEGENIDDVEEDKHFNTSSESNHKVPSGTSKQVSDRDIGHPEDDGLTAMLNHSSDRRGVVRVTVHRTNLRSPLGIGVREKAGFGIVVDHIRGDSIFKPTKIQEHMLLVSINGNKCCNMTKEEAVKCLKSCGEVISLEAEQLAGGSVETMEPSLLSKAPFAVTQKSLVQVNVSKPQANSKMGLSIANKVIGRRTMPIIFDITPGGLCDKTQLRANMQLLSINNMHCPDRIVASRLLQKCSPGEISIVAGPTNLLSVTVHKERPDSKVGLALRHHPELGFVVDSIYSDSLFAGTDLKTNMKVLMVNGIFTEDLESNQVLKLVSHAENVLTIVAEPRQGVPITLSTAPEPISQTTYSRHPMPPQPLQRPLETTVTTAPSIMAGSQPPAGALDGGEWGSGTTSRLLRRKKHVALYRDPNGRVYDTKGKCLGSSSATNWKPNPAGVIGPQKAK